MLCQFLDDEKKPLDAQFEAEDGFLILHSRGGTKGASNARNTDYARGLRLLLGRLAGSDLELSGVWVDSTRVQVLPLEERQIYFAGDAAIGPTELFTLLSRRMAAVGRDPSASSGHGNSNKRLRFAFAGQPSATEIARVAGSRRIEETDEGRTGRLPAAELNRVSDDDIWWAVQSLLAGRTDHPFGESTDYDVIADDGALLPPKAVFGLAASKVLRFQVLPRHFSAGERSICFRKIRHAGFRIVRKSEQPPVEEDPPLDPEDRTWSEGNPRLVTHLRRERKPGLTRAKKAEFVRLHGKLFCERCGLVPSEKYGEPPGDACIEIHHEAVQVSDMEEGHATSLDQLKCLCANCHRMVHRELRDAVRSEVTTAATK